MHTLHFQLESSIIRADSTDGGILASLRGFKTVEIEFRDHAFRQYEADGLSYQLGRLLTTLWTEARLQRREVLRNNGFELQEQDGFHWNGQARELIDLRETGQYGGSSSDESITIESEGWRTFEVRIDDHVFGPLDEADFIDTFYEALTDLSEDLKMADYEYKQKVYGWDDIDG